MDINSNVPSSLQKTWDKVSSDGKIDVNDYEALLKAAAPNSKNEEFDNSELEFLTNIKDQINNSSGEFKVNQGSAQSSVSLFDDNVPSSLQETWKDVSSDGKIDTNDYQKLLHVASPNGKDSELDHNEIKFLSDLKGKIEAGLGETEVAHKESKNPLSSFEGKVPESLRKEWKQAAADGKITPEEYTKLVKTASPNGHDEELDDGEIKFLSELKDLVKNNEKKEPDTGINNVPDSLKEVWKSISADGKITVNEYATLLNAASPNQKDNEFDEKELNFLSNLKKELEMGNGEISLKNN